jgi:hypothetical protein
MPKERKFQVSAVVTISLWAEVEAKSAEEAKEKAQELSMPSLCHQCAGGGEDGVWGNSGEFDGEAQDIHVEEG